MTGPSNLTELPIWKQHATPTNGDYRELNEDDVAQECERCGSIAGVQWSDTQIMHLCEDCWPLYFHAASDAERGP